MDTVEEDIKPNLEKENNDEPSEVEMKPHTTLR